MKSNNITYIICSMVIGISMIVSSLILHNEVDNSVSKIDTTQENSELKPLFTVTEAAEYLGITESEVWIVIKASENNAGVSFPTIKIENKTYISTIGLIEWLKNSIYENRVYN
ncbi:helix-turn-helix domain-containing protein [Fusibacter bizertensis]